MEIRADWAFSGGGLKETGTPTERLIWRVNTGASAMGSMRTCVLVETQNTRVNQGCTIWRKSHIAIYNTAIAILLYNAVMSLHP